MKRLISILITLCNIHTLALAASSSSSGQIGPTTTTVAPTKTYCPQFYTTVKSPLPTDYTCGVVGTLAQRDEISRHCYEPYSYGISYTPVSETDCYRSCSNEPRCISYAWDFYENICYLYGKTLIDMGFKKDSNSSQTHWNLRGCHVCNVNALPPRPGCPKDPIRKSANDTVGYYCDAEGLASVEYSNYVSTGVQFFLADPEIDECYRKCRRYSAYGACEAWIYGTGDFTSSPGCALLTVPLKQIGWNTSRRGSEYSYYGYNLRGCYECNLAPTTTYPDGCVPSPHTVAPVLKNGDFSKTVFNQAQNATVPAAWRIGSELAVSSVTGANGNTFVSFRPETNASDGPAIYGFTANFSENPYTDSRFYNVTFDLALPRLNRTGVSSCVLFLGIWLNRMTINLLSLKVGTTFQKMGPYLVDASKFYIPAFQIECPTGQGKLELWLDNVQVTQRGRVVAGAGTGQ